jgi:hypothetical protein
MENEDRKLFRSIKRASILSGIGMGLLLGLIMGLSVSEVVKVVMATLTAVLGAFLGFDKRSFAGMAEEEYQKEKQNTLFTALRAGWFGIAVVGGILFGMWIRTNQVFTVSVSKSVQEWTDAGYTPEYARKLVTFQRFAINPQTGELGAITEVQKEHTSNLFSSQQAKDLCGATDPDQWNGDWKTAKEGILELEDKALVPVVNAIEANISDDQRFAFLKGLQNLLCYLGGDHPKLCGMVSDINVWAKNDATYAVAAEIAKLSSDKQHKMMEVMSELICRLEKE